MLNSSRCKFLSPKFIPLDPSTRRTEAIVEKEGKQFFVLKGAVTTVLPLCKNPKDELSAVEEKVESLSTKGYRAIAVPKGTAQDHMKLVGIAFLYVKVRPDTLNLIEELRDLGIKVKMLTGDALPIVKKWRNNSTWVAISLEFQI